MWLENREAMHNRSIRRSATRSPDITMGLAIVLLTGNALVGGCGVDFAYLIPAAAGQIKLLWRSVPIGVAIRDGRLTEDQVAKLEAIQDARAYARDVMGLNIKNNFTKFYDSGGKPVAFNVSACRKDAFEPRLWRFPIVGTVPYLGFFDRAAADAEFNRLAGEGLDVFMYEIEAYSGIGFIPNLVLSPLLERSEIHIVETIFHELLHSTIWRPNDTSFNESLATFYGRTGTVEYLADRYPDLPELVQEAIGLFEDSDRYTDFMLTLFNDLDAFYSSDLSTEDKIAGREAVYQAGRDRFATEVQHLMNWPERYDWVRNLPANNAWMLGVRRYNLDLEVFEQVFTAADRDWVVSLRLFRDAAGRLDPYGYLRASLTSHDGVPQVQSSGTRPALTGHGKQPPLSVPQRASRGPCPARLATTILCPE
ncbi:MAG: aminopeptidase [Phycisphaerales bacterium]|nr:MAG: aminopeptidase [Phycisphaerales bacterium]